MSSQQSSLFLTHSFTPQHRYARSVNLERDLARSEAIAGYILTPRAFEALIRIFQALKHPKNQRAWMITGVYGIGKSAFAQFLAVLCGPKSTTLYGQARAILDRACQEQEENWPEIEEILPKKSLFRAIATGQAEPLRWTVIRA
ncbi:MAG: hypothetical protein VKK80_10765, partial [Prochlorothrix sp.]|nr:hypothetical protein [Prochlorothrix sp.]